MNQQITILEALSQEDTIRFWEALHQYHIRDVFPDPAQKEELQYFLSGEYQDGIQRAHDRAENRCRYFFFRQENREIGFALAALFTGEDGKLFILEFCIYPEYRSRGLGHACAGALLDWSREQGGRYAELNCAGPERRMRFWKSIGFVPNGFDEWGEPLLLLPPKERIPFTVERLTDPEDWQLLKLENGFRQEVGEPCLTEAQQSRLQKAVQENRITFFIAKRGYRSIGMCSVAPLYSTFACGDMGVMEDFYIEPAFRRQGAARLLQQAAHSWAAEQGYADLSVTCAPCDESMYRALGYEVPLGLTLARMS